MNDRLLTIEEVAEYLNLAKEEVEGLVAKGKLPAYKVGGSFLRFKKEQMDIYKDTHSPNTLAESALLRDRVVKSYSPQDVPAEDIRVDDKNIARDTDRNAGRQGGLIHYTFWEKLEDFLYYNDFYIISMILLVLVILAVFEF